MKTLSTAAMAFCLATIAFAQSPTFNSGTQQWFHFTEPGDGLELSHFFESQKLNLGYSEQAGLKVVDQWTDYLGHEHIRGQQTEDDIPVEGAMLLIHSSNGVVTHANGHIVEGDFMTPQNVITEPEAFEVIKELYKDVEFYHEMEGMEALIKELENDPDATFKPSGELVFADKSYSKSASSYRLAWKFEVYTQKEIDREFVFVDAMNGNVLFKQAGTSSGCYKNHDHSNCTGSHNDVHAALEPLEGRGLTRYIDEQPFTTDSVAPDVYVLRDLTRGDRIETLNANRGTNAGQASDFIDEDNYWIMDKVRMDDAALDAHHGAQMTYDFWNESYGWSSFDGNGTAMLCYVHWDVGWFNASWNGRFSRYGDGNGDPLTYIDVVAHEFTHGLTGNTSRLIYADESGALNESFSDIFGIAVEFYAQVPTASWDIGIKTFVLRDMSNPNRRGHPDTYLGNNWHTASSDNGGVHTNSGVQNYWYYLLVNGGSGTNDNGDDFQVDSLGFEKATAIAFRNNTTYLTPSSQYYDARLGALQSARDLFGECSYEVEQVAKAWAAVGIGSPTIHRDLQILEVTDVKSSCDLENVNNIGLKFRYNLSGCTEALTPVDTIEVGLRISNGTEIIEKMILDQDYNEGQEFEYIFDSPVDLSEPGLYLLDYWINLNDDDYTDNDTIFRQEVRNPLTLVDNTLLTFRNFTAPLDSLYMIENEHSLISLFISSKNPRPGLLAIQMTGQNASPDVIVIPNREEDNFVLNPEFGSSLCFCIDATDWTNLFASFDIRQTFSEFYRQNLGFDIPQFASCMRVTANGEQASQQYHPVTYTQDEWENQVVDLSDYAGGFVEVCFEGKHFIDRELDQSAGATTQGDYTYLDNIEFFGRGGVSSNDLEIIPLQVVPNPASDVITITAELGSEESVGIILTDISGKNVLSSRSWTQGGLLSQEIEVGQLARGFYTLQVIGEFKIAVQKVVLE